MESFDSVKIKQCVRNSILSSILSYTTGCIALHVNPETSVPLELFSVLLLTAFILAQCWISMKTIKSAHLIRSHYANVFQSNLYKLFLNLLEPFCWGSNSLFTGYLAGLFGRLLYRWSELLYLHILLGNYLILATFMIFYLLPEKILLKNSRSCTTIVLSAHILCYVGFIEEYHLFFECYYASHVKCDPRIFYLRNIFLQLCVTLGVFVLFFCYFTEYKTDRTSPTKHWELCLKFIFIPVRLCLNFIFEALKGFVT